MKRFLLGLLGFAVVWIAGLAPQFLTPPPRFWDYYIRTRGSGFYRRLYPVRTAD